MFIKKQFNNSIAALRNFKNWPESSLTAQFNELNLIIF